MLNNDVVLDINTGRQAKWEVLFQEEVRLEAEVSLFYIKSGQEDIQQYVDEKAKPQIDVYTEDKKAEIEALTDKGAKEINQGADNAQQILINYVENTSKPEINLYAAETVKPTLQSFADELAESLESNAAEKMTAIDALVKQAQTSAEAAANSVSSAQAVVSEASGFANAASQSADNARKAFGTAQSWAIGSLAERPEGSAKYWAQSIDSQKLIPTGLVAPFAGFQVPAGWLCCNGSAVRRDTYSALFAVIGTAFGGGDGSTTFNLPNFMNRTFWGDSRSGIVKEAGLPNIIGRVHGPAGTFAEGCFSTRAGASLSGGTSTFVREGELFFNAGSSHAVYGRSSTVQPPALTTMICIKY